MSLSSIKIASLSDIHLGHPKTPTTHITERLREAFPWNAETAALDLIILAGDVFDRILELPDDDVFAIREWVGYLFKTCHKFGIALRVLEGTPSHDCKQSRVFPEILDFLGLHVDFKYVEELSIEHWDKFGIDILYVPDEWRRDPMVTYHEVLELLDVKGIDKVDFAVMHGAFEYQLPEVARKNHPTHESKLYLDIVRYLIFIGHIHVYSQYDRIIAHGSFDRISHNEERPKGHVRATVTPEHTEITFVENKKAVIYKTVDIEGLDIAEVHKVMTTLDLPKDSHVRLSGRPGDIGLSAIRELQKAYAQYHLTPHTKKKEEIEDELNLDNPAHLRTYTPVHITRDNIWELTRGWLERRGVDEIQMTYCEELLNERIA